ncbi:MULTISPECIES: SpvB/TcaC N-terminal domain-containing protein [unclassified Nonomuraea]|uniref:SpvB/TcaC N-terminal domain-containing protein n=1 Tax=unclassified Nonomuraea TaxID=2593643 RepID=UPI00340E7EC9
MASTSDDGERSRIVDRRPEQTAAPGVEPARGRRRRPRPGGEIPANALLGSASLTIPLPLRSSRSGFGPALALGCDSTAPGSAFCLSWRLHATQITLRTDRGVPRYDEHRHLPPRPGRPRPGLGRRRPRRSDLMPCLGIPSSPSTFTSSPPRPSISTAANATISCTRS